MEFKDIYSQLKEARAEMEHAQKGIGEASTLEGEGAYRKFVDSRQKYWELLDELRDETEEIGKILEEIYSPNLNPDPLPLQPADNPGGWKSR